MLNMPATIAIAPFYFNKAPVSNILNFHQRMRCGNAKIEVGDFVWMDVCDGISKDKLRGHTKGLFDVMNRTFRTFGIQREKVV